MRVVLYNPEIPPNTGNVARLCAALDVPLHLIAPLGFSLEDRYLKRAGLDYWPHVRLTVWPDWEAFLTTRPTGCRLVATSARKGELAHRFAFQESDDLLFGSETKGLPQGVLAQCDAAVRIPIFGQVRSINMSTAAGVILHQAMAVSGLLDGKEA